MISVGGIAELIIKGIVSVAIPVLVECLAYRRTKKELMNQ